MSQKFPYIISIILIILHIISNINNVNAQPLFPAILVFGDSAVDTGNNNYKTPIISPNRANHPPYGRDFPSHKPTGRFSNGKLVPDFLAETLGLKEVLHPYLDPTISEKDLITGVSFGSGGSGFDEFTSFSTGAIPMLKQVEYLREYITKIEKIVGEKQSKEIINKALVVVNAGTDDFVISYYDLPVRRLQYDATRYQYFVLEKVQNFIEELYELGCRTMIVTGLPPIGCLPIQMTTRFKKPSERMCLDEQNSVAMSYNEKLLELIPHAQASLPGARILYADIYTPFMDLINNSHDYGIEVTNKGCCGTGYIEAGSLCNVLTPTCKNASQFMFWDSVHPTEAVYQYLHDSLLEQLGPQLINHLIL
ncbi:GDSL esterase/lipase At2g30310-like [Silene latifolia]|uniref:GDSL esterase/lipase At2g30310-like n=1 Tax=Silene latifolia TaxID=37657 RepID=UPI003D778BED